MEVKGWLKERLTARWFRYIAIPVAAGLPAGLAGVWFGVHQGQAPPYFLKGYQPVALAVTGAWASGLAILKSYLDEIAKDAIKTLAIAQQDLAHLLASVRIVVGAKSKRFFDALSGLPDKPDPARTFFEITQPRLQIKELISAIHGYFQIKVDPNAILRVKVSLMKPQDGALVITDWEPEADVPNGRYERFEGDTIAGLAFHTKQLVISESIAADNRYRNFHGGMIFTAA